MTHFIKTYIDKFVRLSIYITSLILRLILPIKNGRVLLWATVGKDYGCNPMYISEFLVNNESCFNVWWMFIKGSKNAHNCTTDKIVWFRSLKYLYILNTSEFLITNHRTFPRDIFWRKKKGQKYIMTWHGSMPLKKIEKDASNSLGIGYIKRAKADSRNCDLMMSDSNFFTKLLRNSFWYEGEILLTSLPRNQKLLNRENYRFIRNKVLSNFKIKSDDKHLVVLYAPTFRNDNSVTSYITDWNDIKKTLETKFRKEIVILIRLHPNLTGIVDTNTMIHESYIQNASAYSDMQELLIAADILMTDYSSTMFEFALMHKPCFLYIPDKDSYDRGFYFNLSELPFIQCESIPKLLSAFREYDSSYSEELGAFVKKRFGLYEACDGCAEVCKWMKKHSVEKLINESK